MSKEEEVGTLYMIPCPIAIGANGTLSGQIGVVMPGIKYFFVENVRTARRFISSLNLGIDISSLIFQILDKNTDDATVATYFSSIPETEDIGVISEAGCPGVADPGAKAVSHAHRTGRKVVPLVGPSSILLALMASGFSGQQFTFHGYLPIKGQDLDKRIKILETKAVREQSTEIFMETPFRNEKLLRALIAGLLPGTKLCIAMDLTAADAMVSTKTVSQWAKSLPTVHKRPTIFLISA